MVVGFGVVVFLLLSVVVDGVVVLFLVLLPVLVAVLWFSPLGASWKPHWHLLGLVLNILGRSWGCLGASWGRLGGLQGSSGNSWGCLCGS